MWASTEVSVRFPFFSYVFIKFSWIDSIHVFPAPLRVNVHLQCMHVRGWAGVMRLALTTLFSDCKLLPLVLFAKCNLGYLLHNCLFSQLLLVHLGISTPVCACFLISLSLLACTLDHPQPSWPRFMRRCVSHWQLNMAWLTPIRELQIQLQMHMHRHINLHKHDVRVETPAIHWNTTVGFCCSGVGLQR